MTYSVYKVFTDLNDAETFVEYLKEQNIDAFIAEDDTQMNLIFGEVTQNKKYYLKIKQQDFQLVDELLKAESEKNIELLPDDYYLFSYSDGELWDILKKADEWSAFDVSVAKKRLRDKGHVINDRLMQSFKEERVKSLSVQEDANISWLVIGYILTILTGVAGIFWGLNYLNADLNLPNGKKISRYTQQTLLHGRILLALGIIVSLINLYRIYRTTQ